MEAKEWSVIIVWECELEKNRLPDTIAHVSAEIKANGALYQQRKAERKAERERRREERVKKEEHQIALRKELSAKIDALQSR